MKINIGTLEKGLLFECSKSSENSEDIPIDTLQDEALVRLDDARGRVVSDSEALQINKSDDS